MPVERRFEPSKESLARDGALDKLAEKLRADPQTLERARTFARLRDELHLGEEEIARRVGVHKIVVSRLLALVSPDASKRIELTQQAANEQLTVRETERRVREAVKSASAQTSGAAIASAPAESATRAGEESSSRAPLRSSEPSVSAPTETRKRVAEESAHPSALHSAEPSVSAPTETRKRVAEESAHPSALHSAEPNVSAPMEMQKTFTRESTSSVHSPDAIAEQTSQSPVAAQATIEDVPSYEIERRMQLSGMLTRHSPTIEQKIASWCIALGSVVRGPLRNAIWELYERMTEAATWWRMLKALGKLFARLFPGWEPRPTKLQKAIKECFRFLHEPPPSESKSQPKKPDADPPNTP